VPRARRRLALLLPGVFALAASPALVQEVEHEPRDQIVLSGDVRVERGEDVGEVVVLLGRVQVAGVAHGDVVVLDGEISVTGQVSGSVVSVDGPVTIGPDAQIGGDVIARDRVRIAEGARIGGEVRDGTAFTFRTPVALFGPFAAWFALAISTLGLGGLLTLVAPRGVEALAAAARTALWSSLGWGLAAFVGLPVLGTLAVVSLVGLPFGLGVLFGLLLVYSLGFAGCAFALGRGIVREPRSRWLALGLGWAILAALAAVPFGGGFVWFAGAVYGLGAATVAIWRARGVGGRHRPGAMIVERAMQEEGTGI